jgi:hypothetical protein
MDIIESLKSKANAKDAQSCLDVLREMQAMLVAGNVDLGNAITTPVVITELHTLLQTQLGVPQRAMLVGRRIPNRMQRASLFVRAMENGVKKVL